MVNLTERMQKLTKFGYRLSLLEQSYELSQIELSVSTEVEHLVAMQRMSSETLEFDNKCYGRHLSTITTCKLKEDVPF